jgi:tryptophanyl-tRNA synthetase
VAGKQRVFSGVKPTNVPHLGNFLGAFRNWVAQQERYEAFYCVVDLHALTEPWDPSELAELAVDTTAVLIACGVDPDRSVVFRQSDVSQHAELAWILTCISRMGELRRMIQFKERSQGHAESVGAGLFIYPVLQAADVLLYQAHGVPVGDDQRQHIELMRDLAVRFNSTFGTTFVVPEAWVPPAAARIMALDDPTQKMSKSARRPDSSISLIDPPEVVAKKIRSAVTDSGRDVVASEDKPAVSNLLTIFAALEGRPVEEIEQRFAGKGYADFKSALAEVVIATVDPIRTRYLELTGDRAQLDKLVALGAERARGVAEDTMVHVWERTGLGRRPNGR